MAKRKKRDVSLAEQAHTIILLDGILDVAEKAYERELYWCAVQSLVTIQKMVTHAGIKLGDWDRSSIAVGMLIHLEDLCRGQGLRRNPLELKDCPSFWE